MKLSKSLTLLSLLSTTAIAQVAVPVMQDQALMAEPRHDVTVTLVNLVDDARGFPDSVLNSMVPKLKVALYQKQGDLYVRCAGTNTIGKYPAAYIYNFAKKSGVTGCSLPARIRVTLDSPEVSEQPVWVLPQESEKGIDIDIDYDAESPKRFQCYSIVATKYPNAPYPVPAGEIGLLNNCPNVAPPVEDSTTPDKE